MMFPFRRTALALLGGCSLLAGCASPPLRLYTLGTPAHHGALPPHDGTGELTTIEISRVILPDYLDCQDIITRHGAEILRSPRSRWVTRLSLGMADLISNEVSATHPNALISDQPLADTADIRVQIDISQFDVDTSGHASLNAHWAVAPHDPQKPLIRKVVHLTADGPATTDAETATLMRNLVIQLADKVGQSIQAGR